MSEFSVEKILGHITMRRAYELNISGRPWPIQPRITGYQVSHEEDYDEHCHYLYLVKWWGFPESDNTWEPERNFHGDGLIDVYKRKHNLPKRHETFTVKDRRIFKKPKLSYVQSIPLPSEVSSVTDRSSVKERQPRKKSEEGEPSRREQTPRRKSKKRRQIIVSEDEEEQNDSKRSKECSVELGIAGSSAFENGGFSSGGEFHQPSSSTNPPAATKKNDNQVSAFEAKKKDSEGPNSHHPKTKNTDRKKEKNHLKENAKANHPSLTGDKKMERISDKGVSPANRREFENVVNTSTTVGKVNDTLNSFKEVLDAPSMEELFGEEDPDYPKDESKRSEPVTKSPPTIPTLQSAPCSEQPVESISQHQSEGITVIRYMNQPRDYDSEIVMGNVLQSRRWTSAEDLLCSCREKFVYMKRQNMVAKFFTKIIKKNQTQRPATDSSKYIQVDMKISHDGDNPVWKTKSTNMKKLLLTHSLPSQVPAVGYTPPEKIAVSEVREVSQRKRVEPAAAPSSNADSEFSQITKVTFTGVTPTVVEAIYGFIHSVPSAMKMPDLLNLVTAFLNSNSTQVSNCLRDLSIEVRAALLKELIEHLMMYLHEGRLKNFTPQQCLLAAESANPKFRVGSRVPEYCGSAANQHWKCGLLTAILRSTPGFAFGENGQSIFSANSLLHCLQYGSACLQGLFSSVAHLGVGFADVGRFKIDSNMLPMLRTYSDNFMPLFLQNGFDPNALIESGDDIVSIADALQELNISTDWLGIMNDHSEVLSNYATKKLESALVNYPKLTIFDPLTMPHVLRSLGGREDWIGKTTRILGDNETTAKRILTLNNRFIEEEDIQSKTISIVLAVNFVNMVATSKDDVDELLGDSAAPIIVTPDCQVRTEIKAVMIETGNGTRHRKSFELKPSKLFSSDSDKYFTMVFNNRDFLKAGKIDIVICLTKKEKHSNSDVEESDCELQCLIVQLFAVSRRLG